MRAPPFSRFFFFNDTATTEIYTLSLHDALPISSCQPANCQRVLIETRRCRSQTLNVEDRKSTRLNSSHTVISYAVFCLNKKQSEALGPPPRPLPYPRQSLPPTSPSAALHYASST